MRTDQPFSLILVAVSAPGLFGMIVAAFKAPSRLPGNPLRFAPLITLLTWIGVCLPASFVPGLTPLLAIPVAVWVLVQAVLFGRLKTRFGTFVAVCSVLFALGIANVVGPYLYVVYLKPA